LLLDIHLGGISGIELQRRLAASGSKWPVIFMTANDDAGTRSQAMDAGCIAYLRKPFAQDVLLNAISEAAAYPPRRFDRTTATSGLSPVNEHSQDRWACLKCAKSGGEVQRRKHQKRLC